jgi:hypothetical protein
MRGKIEVFGLYMPVRLLAATSLRVTLLEKKVA